MSFVLIYLLKMTLVLVISALLLLIFRHASASLRHWIISLSLIGLLILPLFIKTVPELTVAFSGAEMLNELVISKASKTSVIEAGVVHQEMVDEEAFSKSLDTKKPIDILILFHVLISGLFLLRLILGVSQVAKLSKKSKSFHFNKDLDYRPVVPVLSSPEIKTPMTWGFFNPVILLPAGAEYWSNETLATVLFHEMAHIKRGDYLIHILSLVSVSLYWFHPLVWWMKKRQLLEREKACDEAVLKSGVSEHSYAAHLVEVARALSVRQNKIHNYALPMAQMKEMKQRIVSILNFNRASFRFNQYRQFFWALFFVSMILLFSALTPAEPVVEEWKELEENLGTRLAGNQFVDEVAEVPVQPLPKKSFEVTTDQKGALELTQVVGLLQQAESLREKIASLPLLATSTPSMIEWSSENSEWQGTIRLDDHLNRVVNALQAQREIRKEGRHVATKTMTGGNGLKLGTKFGSVIQNVPEGAVLQDFNFNFRRNDFRKTTFQLRLYEVNTTSITRTLTATPIQFEFSNAQPWISVDLTPYQIKTGGDVLAILELVHAEGDEGQGYLFFAQGKGMYTSFHQQSGKDWDFWEAKYAFYFNVAL